MSAYRLDVLELYRLLDVRRRTFGLSWRRVAAEVGMSPSAFTRMAGGLPPHADHLVSLLVWLGMDAEIAHLIKLGGDA